jgi:hypothetical protein
VGSFIQHPTTVYGDCELPYMRFVPRIEDKFYFISKCTIFSTDHKALQNGQFLAQCMISMLLTSLQNHQGLDQFTLT